MEGRPFREGRRTDRPEKEPKSLLFEGGKKGTSGQAGELEGRSHVKNGEQ